MDELWAPPTSASPARPPRGGWVLPWGIAALNAWVLLVAASFWLSSLPGYAVGDGAFVQQRFDHSRDDFEKTVRELPPPVPGEMSAEGWESVDVPRVIGGYRISDAARLTDGAVILYSSAGGFLFDDAGFACLPHRPKPEYSTGWFEDPQWHPLGGCWYRFISSW